MKAFLSALVVAVVIAGGAGFVINSKDDRASYVFTEKGVRVGDPGHNLIGDQ